MSEELHVTLSKKPKNATVIEGFPGMGLVATIATGFLQEHLKCEKIGSYYFQDPPASVAIHNSRVIDPISVWYNKKHNIIIIHAVMNPQNNEYKAASLVLDVCKQVQAKELIMLEGVGSPDTAEQPRAFSYCSIPQATAKMQKIGVQNLGEGIIVGATGALLMKQHEHKTPITCIFVETHSRLPDSKAAAKAVETVDKYLGLDVPYAPLLKQAEQMEQKLKGIMEEHSRAQELKDSKDVSYLG